jgi:integrase
LPWANQDSSRTIVAECSACQIWIIVKPQSSTASDHPRRAVSTSTPSTNSSPGTQQPTHFVFPHEKYGAAGEPDRFGFVAGSVVYDTDPTRPIGEWKAAWEKAKERAGTILTGKTEDESEPLKCRFHDLRHTAVTRLLEAGIPYPVVASILGWSAATTIRMAKR